MSLFLVGAGMNRTPVTREISGEVRPCKAKDVARTWFVSLVEAVDYFSAFFASRTVSANCLVAFLSVSNDWRLEVAMTLVMSAS
jgi:hypothetical protein